MSRIAQLSTRHLNWKDRYSYDKARRESIDDVHGG